MSSSSSGGVALIPLRAQPLHTGHCNLLRECHERFDSLVILLSTKHGGESNPYSYQTRKTRLEQAAEEYSLSLRIFPLPSFSSPMHISKSAEEVDHIRKKFFALAGGTSFTLISGNASVTRLCHDTYRLPVETVGVDFLPAWHMPLPNPFKHYESNGGAIRNTIQQNGKSGVEKLQAQGLLPKRMDTGPLLSQDLTASS